MAPAPLSFLPLSPSPSPPSEHALFLHDMLAQSQGQHPPVHPHPSLMYHPHASPGSAASSPGFEYPDPMQHASLPQSDSPPPGQAGKRYRSAPPKTFQCAGYGECRMVFSRSEHLARHIRKHTGERPFACHCTKQFSRLDNLRQHAQTVHSAPEDKPLNERMMRALAGVNASMMAGVRGRRRFSPPSSISSSPNCSSSSSAGYPSHPSSQYGGGSHPGSPTTASFAQQYAAPYPSPSFPPHHAAYQFGSPMGSPASTSASSAAFDYLSAGEVYIKQEEIEVGSGSTMGGGHGAEEAEAFYAALQAPAPASFSGLSHPHGQQQHQLSSYPSSSSLSSLSSLSSSAHSQSAGSSPPCSPTFWGQSGAEAQQQQQRPRQGGEYLPSPPQSPPYYASSHPSSHSHPQHHAQQAYWAGAQAGEGEMSNAQYYAALQHQGEYGQRGNGVHGAQYGAGVYA